MSRCLEKSGSSFAKCCLCREKVPVPKTLSRGAKREQMLLSASVPCYIVKWLTQGHTKYFVHILKKQAAWGNFLYWVKSGFNLVVSSGHLMRFGFFLFFWWLCWRWLRWFCPYRRSFPLRLGCLQAGTGSCIQVCKFKYERNSTRREPVCARLEEDANYPFLINNSAISSLVCHFITDSVSDLRGTLRAGGCGRAGLPCRRWAGGSLDPKHHFFGSLIGLGSRGVLRSWNEPVKMFAQELLEVKLVSVDVCILFL